MRAVLPCLADEGHYARTYHKGAWVVPNDRGVAIQNFSRMIAMNISRFSVGSNPAYKGINTNSKQYKAAAKDYLANHRAEVAKMSPQERQMYGLFGGEQAYMRNVMKMYNSDGDYVGADGSVVPGMVATGIPESERHQMISVSEDYRQEMFNLVKKEFISENGVANGDTTKRSSVYREYQLSIAKEDRLKGTWSMQQYESKYRKAMYDAVRASNPSWKPGQSFDTSVLDSITRESVEGTLIKNGNTLVKKTSTGSSLDIKI